MHNSLGQMCDSRHKFCKLLLTINMELSGFLGSDANFMTMQSIAPKGRAKGTMNLDSDPKNPKRNAAIHPKNEFIEVPLSRTSRPGQA